MPPLPSVPKIPGTRRWRALIEHARQALTMARNEMESYQQDRSETWQESDRGETLQNRIEKLETILDGLNELDD